MIGGGYGITSVVAGRQVRESGVVTVYEPSLYHASQLGNTTDVNNISEIVNFQCKAVGKIIESKGSVRGAEQIPVADIPRCDVIEMDCEGAETHIIANLCYEPDTIIIETALLNSGVGQSGQNLSRFVIQVVSKRVISN